MDLSTVILAVIGCYGVALAVLAWWDDRRNAHRHGWIP